MNEIVLKLTEEETDLLLGGFVTGLSHCSTDHPSRIPSEKLYHKLKAQIAQQKVAHPLSDPDFAMPQEEGC